LVAAGQARLLADIPAVTNTGPEKPGPVFMTEEVTMLETQTIQAMPDGFIRCRDRSWLSLEEQDIYGATDERSTPVGIVNDPVEIGAIQPGQKVFAQDDQFLGKVTKIASGLDEQSSHFIIRTQHFLGRLKIMPFEYVDTIRSEGIHLSITREKFQGFPDYKTDAVIYDEIDRALWSDQMLRYTDYRQIDVRVKDGCVFLSGHVISTQNKRLIENTVWKIPGILGFKIHLIADDVLVLKVAGALGQVEHEYGVKFYTGVHHGVVEMSGEVGSLEVRCLAEKCVASIPWVRGVINDVSVPGEDIKAVDRRFLQPRIDQEIFFDDGYSGNVKRVIITPGNRRVTGMIVERRDTDPHLALQPLDGSNKKIVKRLVVIPLSEIDHLTQSAGFLRKNGQKAGQYADFDIACFALPEINWTPPYPYCPEDVLFPVENMSLIVDKPYLSVPQIQDETIVVS
jgi:osmotically-inducible protein OsmY